MAAKNLRKYMGNGDVRNAIRRLGKQMAAELTDEEVFLSPEFRKYANNLASFILRKHKLYSLDIIYDTSDSAPVAYTDGKNIVLNCGNPLAKYPKLLEGRFKVNMGVLFHECAHKLFLDFDAHRKAMDTLEHKKLFGNFDIAPGSYLESYHQEMAQALADGYVRTLQKIYAEVTNIINDGHDEGCMKDCFPGVIAQSIKAAGEVQMALTPPLSEVVDKRECLSIFYSNMLQYAKYGYCNWGEENDSTRPYIEMLSKMEPIIDDALAEHNYTKRWDHINLLVLHLWPTIRDLMNQQDSTNSGGSGQNGSGGGGGSGNNISGNSLSDEELAQLAQSLAQAAQDDNGAAPAPLGTGKAVLPQAVSSGQGGVSADSEADIASILGQLGQEKAAQSVQNDIDKAQLDAIRNIKAPLIHRNADVDVCRHHPVNEGAYEEIYDEVKPIVRNLTSAMQALLRECNEEAIQHHRRYGPIIEATEAYRPDGAFFAKKKLPEDRPNMAMCVLLDESGSMGGSKIRTSKKALIMLERFASGLGIPLMVAGHYAGYGDVCLNIYTDFVSAQPEKDRYSLAAIDSHGCNRDGLPLRVCAEMLAQRPEQIRLMVVISDGAPNDTGYQGEAANEDIRKTVAEFRRKGLLIYGAAIDDDREVIQSLYGSGFLNITDLQSLPKTMVRLLRQNII